MPVRVALDTDIGDDIDDAFALALASLSPELELKGVTTVYGDVQARAELAARLLGALGRDDVPVAVGASHPLVGEAPTWRPTYYEGLKGVEGRSARIVEVNAVDFLEELVEAGEIDVLVTVGPFTNAALLFLKRPDLAGKVRLVSMCGAFTLNMAEYNIKCDPEAAGRVLAAPCDKLLIGLDVTLKCRMSREMVEELYGLGGEYARVLSSYLRIWMERSGHLPILHDPLAVATVFAPDLVKAEPVRVEVELAGRHTRGYTVVVSGKPNARVCKDVDADRFLRLFAERVLRA